MTPFDPSPLAGRRLIGLFPIHNTGGAISYIAGSIFGEMQRQGADVRLWVPTSDPAARKPCVRVVFPWGVRWLAYRIVGERGVARLTARQFAGSLRPGDIAYIWPGADLEAYQRARDRGAVVVTERINCPTREASRILNAEAAAVGRPADHAITDADFGREQAELEAADFVFSPSPLVAAGLTAGGVPPGKILHASYGWDPARVTPGGVARPGRPGGLRVLFVGLLCMRKGVHRLLDAWKLSGVRGQLTLAGRLTEGLADWRSGDLARPDVVLTGHVSDVAALYAAADVFAFPSFEEAGPLVTYEACGASLPSVLSPMGAGAVARDGREAIVLPPDDVAGWADAFRRLAADPELRARMSRSAVARAAEFTWERCAAARLELLREALSGQTASGGNHADALAPVSGDATVTSAAPPARTNP